VKPGAPRQIAEVVVGLDRWFDVQRTDWPVAGYGGPVVHWWNHQLAYQGTGLDWRYEGIIAGYLTLWERTGERGWLSKAIRAGQDLLAGRVEGAHFANSRFELNPGTGGTPHEAAVDIALLRLSAAVEPYDPDLAREMLQAAEDNIEQFWIASLWDHACGSLRDDPATPSFVPNKAATFVEAILLLAERTGDVELVERYAIPTGHAILAMQVGAGERMAGGIAQNRYGDTTVPAFFPLYIARCVPPLLQLHEVTGDEQFRTGSLAAARFLGAVRYPDGSFPQVLYPRGRANRYPRWIAGSGDILRALMAANAHGAEISVEPTLSWLLAGAREDGRIATAQGFGRVMLWVSRRHGYVDELGVVGWCDKAFRALTNLVDPAALMACASTTQAATLEGGALR
jgi:hypothetical protein